MLDVKHNSVETKHIHAYVHSERDHYRQNMHTAFWIKMDPTHVGIHLKIVLIKAKCNLAKERGGGTYHKHLSMRLKSYILRTCSQRELG